MHFPLPCMSHLLVSPMSPRSWLKSQWTAGSCSNSPCPSSFYRSLLHLSPPLIFSPFPHPQRPCSPYNHSCHGSHCLPFLPLLVTFPRTFPSSTLSFLITGRAEVHGTLGIPSATLWCSAAFSHVPWGEHSLAQCKQKNRTKQEQGATQNPAC